MADITRHDERRIRCRRLGHVVTFHYCRTQEGESVCARILDCWWEIFEVEEFLHTHAPELIAEITEGAPSPRVLTLLEMAQNARKAQEYPDASEPEEMQEP